MVVAFVITGEIWFMLTCRAGSRGVSFGPPKRVNQMQDTEGKILQKIGTLALQGILR